METRYSKAGLLSQMKGAPTELNENLDPLTQAQFQDSQSWTVKDHLTPLAAWERSVVIFM